MGWPIHPEDHVDTPEAQKSFTRHLMYRETIIAISILILLMGVALTLATLLFPAMWALGAMFFFAYMLLFTLPMWGGLFEDDIEDQKKLHQEHEQEDSSS
ncbi:MAG: hypothetical protein O7G85_04230 [Planctomycetota bacterium]|nr:hypothetical protein [Planctomycetota bacterium]